MNKKLTKSANNVVITGTLGGLAEYLRIDPTIVRVIYVFLSLVTLCVSWNHFIYHHGGLDSFWSQEYLRIWPRQSLLQAKQIQ